MLNSLEALKLVAQNWPENGFVVCTMTGSREWCHLAPAPDRALAVRCMGKASSIGLGLALARPDLKVIVIDGDGSLLMNSGSLITIGNKAPTNLVHFVMENGVYRTTGGQPVPAAGKFDLATLAKASGYAKSHCFGDLSQFAEQVSGILNEPGPTLVCLKVPAATERAPFESPVPTAAFFNDLKSSLEATLAKVRAQR